MNESPSWDEYHMQAAEHAATKSKDRSTKVGAVIVGPDNETLISGFNGFPRGVNDDIDERHERPEKYFWAEHAERNSLYAAARHGVSVKGCRMFVPLFPCADCARAIVQSGIVEVICREVDESLSFTQRWAEANRRAETILFEGGVKVRFIEKEPV